jgi:dTDP-4-dehydrorhamnose 3,5-epimerase
MRPTLNMEIRSLPIVGCYEITSQPFRDERGNLVKTFYAQIFQSWGLETHFVEEFYTISRQGVLRGMHFQVPPEECTKIVFCPHGEVMDVMVDLRIGSPTFGKTHVVSLSAEGANQVYMPPGIAHGYLVRSEGAIVVYKMTKPYSPQCDTGIHWASIGLNWPTSSPIISERDAKYPKLSDYCSPFHFSP